MKNQFKSVKAGIWFTFTLCNKGLILLDYSGINEIVFYLNILRVPFVTLPSGECIDTVFSYLSLESDLLVNRNNYNYQNINSKLIYEWAYYYCISACFIYCPILCVYKSSWHQETHLLTNVNYITEALKRALVLRTAILVIVTPLIASS